MQSDARGIPAGAITQLSTGEYLKNGATIVISGPTGTGKSFLACALGERACRLEYKVRYYTVSRLMDELKFARLEGHELKFFEKIEHLDLLIIDDFGMRRLEGPQQNDFEQIIDDRYHRKSLILSSQLAVADYPPEYLPKNCHIQVFFILPSWDTRFLSLSNGFSPEDFFSVVGW